MSDEIDENMENNIEDKLEKIPVLKYFIKLLKKIQLPALEGLTLYYFLRLYGRGIIKGALTSRASAIAFSFFTAIFPFLLFIIQNIYRKSSGGLLSSVFLLSIILMANGISALFAGFESSYHQQLTRSVVKQYLYSMFVALILTLLLIITIAVIGYFQIYVINSVLYYMDKQGYETYEEGLFMVAIAKYVFFVFMVFIATATLYYFGTKEGKNSKFFSAGALLTTILIIVFSYLFGIYVTYFSTYNELYGSIGALLILLFYLWLNSNILLLGFELNATIMLLKKYNLQKKNNQELS